MKEKDKQIVLNQLIDLYAEENKTEARLSEIRNNRAEIVSEFVKKSALPSGTKVYIFDDKGDKVDEAFTTHANIDFFQPYRATPEVIKQALNHIKYVLVQVKKNGTPSKKEMEIYNLLGVGPDSGRYFYIMPAYMC